MKCCLEVNKFFSFLESIYTFFTGFSERYALLTTNWKLQNLGSDERMLVPKTVDTTRWDSRKQAVRSVSKGVNVYIRTSTELSEENYEARGLLKTSSKLETGVYICFWDDILYMVNKTRVISQSCKTGVISAVLLLKSLKSTIYALRDEFTYYQNSRKEKSGNDVYFQSQKRKCQFLHTILLIIVEQNLFS